MRVVDFNTSKHMEELVKIGNKTSSFAAGKKIIFWSPEILTKWKEKNSGPMLIVLDSKQNLRGFLLATFHISGIATLENIYVDTDFRREGIATRLLQCFENLAVKNKMKIIRTFSQNANKSMETFLRRNNYSIGIKTRWFSVNPNCVFSPTLINLSNVNIRKLTPIDLTKVIEFLNYNSLHTGGIIFNPKIKFADWIESSNNSLYGAFSSSNNILSLIIVSVYESLQKATIDYFGCKRKYFKSHFLEMLFSFIVKSNKLRNITYLSIHPPINKQYINKILTPLGFEKKNIFKAYSKVL